jgi:ribosomal protein S12 methylthiotransferase
MPIQHGSDPVLARMRRPERGATIRKTVERVRMAIPDVALRTTCIVGFPGETDEDFERLLALLEEVQFERVGAFTYSAQEGTRAAELVDDVPESIKRERLERLVELQRVVTAERYERRLGGIVTALVDRVGDRGIEARLACQADDIDGITWVDRGAVGELVEVCVDEVVDDYDFRASTRRIITRASAGPPSGAAALARGRVLPVMGATSLRATSLGSYGR